MRGGAANGDDAALETTISKPRVGRIGIQLLAGFSSARRAGRGARGLGGFGRTGANGAELSGDDLGCGAGTNDATQENLPHLQRLHDRAAKRTAIGMLSA